MDILRRWWSCFEHEYELERVQARSDLGYSCYDIMNEALN